MLISAVAIAAEGVALVVAVLAGGQLVAAALAMLLVRLTGWGVTYAVLRHLEPWVRLGIGSTNLAIVRQLARPSLAALSLTLASSISLQGMVLALGWTAGPAVAAVFGAARFIARVPLQFSGLVVRASLPELTRAQVESNHALVRRLSRINIVSALAPTLPLVPILALAGPALLRAMSGGELEADRWLFAVLATTTMLGALWQAVASPLLAANQQSRFAFAYCAFSVLAIAAILIPGIPPLAAAGIGTLVAELAVTLIVFRLDRQTMSQDTNGHGRAAMADNPGWRRNQRR
jgi:O-antigen/teichoic acid export membrane protein